MQSSEEGILMEIAQVTPFSMWSTLKHELRTSHEQEIFELCIDECCRKADSKLKSYSVYVENLQPVYDHMKAVFNLIRIPMTDLMLNSIVKVDQDPNGRRRSEILNGMKINLDFAHEYFTTRYEKGITGF
uniref:Uncharacterized protein n=1 Tax=Romanomermis culicivorax TaxID=13658 RepID=A0A915JB35_ROMCU